MKYRALEIEVKPVKHRSWNQQFIPKKLEELARNGVYYDSKLV